MAHTLAALAAVPRIEATLVVLPDDDVLFDALLPGWVDGAPGRWLARCGGATRAATVANGLGALRAAACTTTTGCWCTTLPAACCSPNGSHG